ncbi:MAG: phenylalanine--tRNA ligase subunit beta [Gammaproteobacteria bacterium]|nr:phenylalanine--tRNA ligase subunit beta [Gammaproteobacteria bacterium]
MKIVESWLREWVDPDLETVELGHQLTMLGHEVEAIAFEGHGLDGVVVAEVVDVGKHPDADRLSVCKVSAGGREIIDVVCGAPNVFKGMKSPLAMPGLKLPNGVKLRKSKIRGVVSNGMLCSAVELGLGEEADGIISLPADAPVGEPLVDYLELPDAVFDLNLTPNRGDCFCVLGIAREIAALTGAELRGAEIDTVAATIDDTLPVELLEPAGCPVFAGRVIRNIDPHARSPLWMIERLRRAGLREIHPVVDITNYVMLELGQPLHAYDLGLVKGGIRPRLAKRGEKVTLLDEKEVNVNDDTLVITDDSGVIGLAGIMGGLSTAVSEQTTDVFFEAAFWPQEYMAGRARAYGMHTDASMRFERGVDPEGQGRAVERASSLLVEISGGKAGPLVMTTAEEHIPPRRQISLRRNRLAKLLGVEIADQQITDILNRLQLSTTVTDTGWDVIAPPHRFDIEIEADLIEEIARIHGYDKIPETTAIAETPLETVTETRVDMELVASTLTARDYQEVVTYSFVGAEADELISGHASELVLSNPISSEMSVMRSSLVAGMLEAAANNTARQQERVRIFEIGKSFHGKLEHHDEVVRIAALATGPALPEQWGSNGLNVDFFDIKADVEAILRLSSDEQQIDFEQVTNPALQPGQAATITRNGETIGVVGRVHPKIARRFELKTAAYIFELDAEKAMSTVAPQAKSISKFPAIRRDIAVIVDEKISADDLLRAAASAAPRLVTDIRIFDVYQGPGIEAGLKSVAIGLILQETSRTLTDDDADAAQAAAVKKLQQEFAAVLRD